MLLHKAPSSNRERADGSFGNIKRAKQVMPPALGGLGISTSTDRRQLIDAIGRDGS
jgi:hypothetical protein